MHTLDRSQDLPHPLHAVFALVSDVRHLAQIAPSFLDLGWVTDPNQPIAEGARIDYRVRLYGLPFRWRTRITAFDPPHSFSYVQERGPCRYWYHAYRLEAVGETTRLIDEVRYDLGWGPLGPIANHLGARRIIEAMFDHRAARLAALLAASVP